MTYGLAPYGLNAFGFAGVDYDASVPSPFLALLRLKNAERKFIVHATLYDRDAAGETTLRFSDRRFITEPSETPANTRYLPRLEAPVFRFRREISNLDRLGGRSSVQRGDIRIANGDGGLDAYLDRDAYVWAGRSLEVLMGGKDFALADFGSIFLGLIDALSWDRGTVRITLRDRGALSTTQMQPTLYAGTGGLEGSAELAGVPKPILYGIRRNIVPVLVDAANLIYQIHDAAGEAVLAVRDQGVALTGAGDVADITAASVSSGQYKTELDGSNGGMFFRLGSEPDGLITVDAQGDASGAGYVDTPGAIVRRILADRAAFVDPDDLDVAAFAAYELTAAYECGIYLSDATTCSEAIDRLVDSAFGFWGYLRDGRLTLGLIVPPTSPVETFRDGDTLDIRADVAAAPIKTLRLSYRPNGREMTDADFAGSVSAADKEEFKRAGRILDWSDSGVATEFADARDLEVQTLLDDATDAEAVRDRIVAALSVPRRVWQVRAHGLPFVRELGDSVAVTSARFGLSAGRNMRVFGLGEVAGDVAADMVLWG